MSYREFKLRWQRAGRHARAWVQNKARWEAMSLWAVANEWGIPTNAQAKERGVTRGMVRKIERAAGIS